MTSAIFFMYLAGVAEGLSVASLIIVAIAGTFAVVSCGDYLLNMNCFDDHESVILKKITKYGTILCVFFCILAIFTPSKQVCYMLASTAAAEYIMTETEAGKALNENAVNMINDIGKIVHDYANKEKK